MTQINIVCEHQSKHLFYYCKHIAPVFLKLYHVENAQIDANTDPHLKILFREI